MPGGAISAFFPIILMVGLLWWMSRSQKKQQKQRQEQLDSLKIGDNVVTIGGLHGVISEINKEKGTVVLDCEGIYLEFDRPAIKTAKISAAPTSAPTPAPTEEKEETK